LAYRFFGNLWLEKFENHLTEKQINDIQKDIQGLKIKIVWSSSRTGNHEIFMLTLPDLKMVQLTHNLHVDTYPRFSPDGEKIAFCRSQPRWVSQRNLELWDVHLLSLDKNEETIFAKNAFTPQWITNSLITFVKKMKLMTKTQKTGEEKVILDGDQETISSQMITPEILRQDFNFLAITFRGKMDGVFIWNRVKGTFLKIGQECQITWVPSGQDVIWVGNGGNGGTQLLKSSTTHVQQTLFMDLPGGYSHEYFPRLSVDGKWLVWGATAEGHEPDIVDYKIFLWKIGTPFSNAVQLTYKAANDSWPDIFIQN
jgi:Tol biopolymer transport system component